MQPVIRVIATNPEVIPLNHYGKVGASIFISGAATAGALANHTDITSVIGAVTLTAGGGSIDYPADGILITAGVGQTVTICQYGD